MSDRVPAISSVDIPQTQKLSHLRELVEAVAAGHSSGLAISEATGVSKRHVDYNLHSARVLGALVAQDGSWTLTDSGRALLQTTMSSQEEQTWFLKAILLSETIQRLAPNLFDSSGPTLEQLEKQIQEAGQVTQSTARRRAQTLLSWREQLTPACPEAATEKKAPATPRAHTSRKQAAAAVAQPADIPSTDAADPTS